MDLVATLRKKIEVLDDGEQVAGLKAVLLHIETAFRHLIRGQRSDDDTAFTDAIYRTNQAFEGSIKEAYRVLANQDPSRMRPYDIESYLEDNKVFRSRVLNQLVAYRTEWRNPSAHDYKLDFDESEAFLAIVSVSAFACLILDQITERLAFLKSQAEAESQQPDIASRLEEARSGDLLSRVVELIVQFCTRHTSKSLTNESEVQIIGALNGFMSSIAPDLMVTTDEKLVSDRPFRADLVVGNDESRVIVELKRKANRSMYQNAIAQVEHYMLISGVRFGLLVFLPDQASAMDRRDLNVMGISGRLVVLAPKGADIPRWD